MIAPDAYPQMMAKAQAAQFSQTLRSSSTAVNATRIIAASAETLCEALLGYVEELEAAGRDHDHDHDHDHDQVSDKAHEIKGFADTAGRPATARLAEGLCHYLERSLELGAPADAAVIALYVSAIGRATRDADQGGETRQAVTSELAALAARKLAEAGARKC
jgi:HPt (histidine-containing phosphotransfer) domain-containing protein